MKTIGDAVMLVGADAAAAVRLGLRLACEVGDRHGMPGVRVGMHTGEAVERAGDFYGSTVNVAARISAIAAGRQVLLTDATKQAAGPMDDIELHALGARELRHLPRPLVVHEAVWAAGRDGEGLPIDPVCRMAVDPAREAGRLSHQGVEFHFCSLKCAAAFAAAPDRYLS